MIHLPPVPHGTPDSKPLSGRSGAGRGVRAVSPRVPRRQLRRTPAERSLGRSGGQSLGGPPNPRTGIHGGLAVITVGIHSWPRGAARAVRGRPRYDVAGGGTRRAGGLRTTHAPHHTPLVESPASSVENGRRWRLGRHYITALVWRKTLAPSFVFRGPPSGLLLLLCVRRRRQFRLGPWGGPASLELRPEGPRRGVEALGREAFRRPHRAREAGGCSLCLLRGRRWSRGVGRGAEKGSLMWRRAPWEGSERARGGGRGTDPWWGGSEPEPRFRTGTFFDGARALRSAAVRASRFCVAGQRSVPAGPVCRLFP